MKNQKTSILTVLLWISGLVFSAQCLLSQSKFSSTLDGTFQVTNGGAATYTIDLELPKGTAGFEPDLSLVYNSQSTNGILGNGFTLNGLGVISRVGATTTLDGYKGGVNYDDMDRFSLNGQRLINMNVVPGGYAGPGATYFTNIQSWNKVTASGTCGQGPCSFEVMNKKGYTMVFGASGNSRSLAVGPDFEDGNQANSVRQWYIESARDLNGNTIEFTYTQHPVSTSGQAIQGARDNGQLYPDRLFYTSNANGSMTSQRMIRFFYESRPDSIPQYQGGALTKMTARMSRISTYVVNAQSDTVLVRNYDLGYVTTGPSFVSRIQSVSELSAQGIVYAQTTFNWSEEPNSLVSVPYPGSSVDMSSAWMGDLNGDGTTDMIINANNTINTTLISQPDGFDQVPVNPSISVGDFPFIADFNGDGLTDFFNASPTAGSLYLSGGHGFNSGIEVTNLPFPNQPEKNAYWCSDFNGDGKADILIQSGGQGQIFFSNGAGFNDGVDVNGLNFFSSAYVLSDFNGDGLADILDADMDSLYFSNWSAGTSFSRGVSANIDASETSFFADFNGDNLQDMVTLYDGSYFLYFSNGAGFTDGHPLNLPLQNINNLWLGDFNGDDLMDVFANGATNNFIYYSNGITLDSMFVGNQVLGGQTIWIGDFNGDGKSDLVSVESDSLYVNVYQDGSSPSGQGMANLVTSIDNSTGGLYTVDYLPMTDSMVYMQATLSDSQSIRTLGLYNTYNSTPLSPVQGSNYPFRFTKNTQYLVGSYSKNAGGNTHYGYSQFYGDALTEVDGMGWLGFRQVIQTDSSALSRTSQNFHQLYPLTSKIDSSVKLSLDNVILGVNSMDYVMTPGSADQTVNQVFLVNPSQIITRHYDYGDYSYSLIQQFRYDEFGNRRLTIQQGDPAVHDTVVYTIKTYHNDTLSWTIGYLKQTTLSLDSLSASDTLQQSIIAYDGLMNMITEKYWNDQFDRYEMKSYGYDFAGNVVYKVGFGGDTTRVAYDTLYSTFPAKFIRPPNQWGQNLVTELRFNPAFGVIEFLRDPNQNGQIHTYDGIGRDSTMSIFSNTRDTILTSQSFYTPGDDFGTVQISVNLQDWNGTVWDTSWTHLDGAGRKYSQWSRGWNNQMVSSQSRYNSLNNLTGKSLDAFESDSLLWITREYDPYGRLVEVTAPSNAKNNMINRISYDDKRVRLTRAAESPDSTVVTFDFNYYNGKHKVVRETFADSTSQLFNYDAIGQVIQAIDPIGNSYINTYNSLGKTTSMSNPSTGRVDYIYDYPAQQIIEVNALQDSIIKQLDGLNRLIQQTFEGARTIQYQYDLTSHTNAQGKLSQVLMPNGDQYAYSYDILGNIDTLRSQIEGMSFTEVQNFSPTNTILSYMYPDGSETRYTYTSQDLLDSVYLTSKSSMIEDNLFDFLAYDASNHVLSQMGGNNVQSTLSYSPFGKMDSLAVENSTAVLLNQSYKQNEAGIIQTINDYVNPVDSQNFDFYEDWKLKNAEGPYGSTQFYYDDGGNIIQRDSVEYTYNQYQLEYGIVENDTVLIVQYDPLGRVIQKAYSGTDPERFTYSYDFMGNLDTLYRNDSLLYTFGYNYNGQRTSKTDHLANSIEISCGPAYQVQVMGTGEIGSSARHILLPTGLSASITTVFDNEIPVQTDTIYYHQDYLTNTQFLTGNRGGVITEIDYHPFGAVLSINGDDLMKYKYGSKELDRESNLYYFNYRYYDPGLGRFISPDNQLGGDQYKKGVFNNYAYVINQPYQYNDPTGHNTSGIIKDAVGVIALVGAVGLMIASDGTDVRADARVVRDGMELVGDLLDTGEDNRIVERNGKRMFGVGEEYLGKKENTEANWIFEALGNKRAQDANIFDEATIHQKLRGVGDYGGAKEYKFVLRDDGSLSFIDPEFTHWMALDLTLETEQVESGGYVRLMREGSWFRKPKVEIINITGHFKTDYESLQVAKSAFNRIGYSVKTTDGSLFGEEGYDPIEWLKGNRRK